MTAFRLVHKEGTDRLHKWPATERCNLDDTDRDADLDVTEAEAYRLIQNGTVDACQWCFPADEVADVR